MRQEWEANWCQLALGDSRDVAFVASELCTESGERHADAADGPGVLPESHWRVRRHQQTETWFINKNVPAQKSLMVASSDGAEYALLDPGSGLTSCPINYADDISFLPRHSNAANLEQRHWR